MIDLKLGDCFELMQNVPDNSVDLVVTDPPYLIETSGGGIYKQANIHYANELSEMKDGFAESILDEFCRALKKINIYIFCSQKQIIPLLDYFVKRKKCNWNLLCWHKSNTVPNCGNKYLTDTEYALFFREKGVRIYGSFNTKRTYYVTSPSRKDKKTFGHPTVKPLEIVQNMVLNSSQEHDMVLDPFMGSGTTGVASVKANRSFIGMEKVSKYFDIAKQRIEQAQSEVIP